MNDEYLSIPVYGRVNETNVNLIEKFFSFESNIRSRILKLPVKHVKKLSRQSSILFHLTACMTLRYTHVRSNALFRLPYLNESTALNSFD